VNDYHYIHLKNPGTVHVCCVGVVQVCKLITPMK
jgi:hypothetical protein